MYRMIAMTGMLTSGLLAASVAIASPDVQIERVDVAPRIDRASPGQADLMRSWSVVGKCVVQRDRVASLAFVRSTIGSDDALAAQRRLDPVFAGCLAGSRVPGPSSVVLRRAALAEALGLSRTRT